MTKTEARFFPTLKLLRKLFPTDQPTNPRESEKKIKLLYLDDLHIFFNESFLYFSSPFVINELS